MARRGHMGIVTHDLLICFNQHVVNAVPSILLAAIQNWLLVEVKVSRLLWELRSYEVALDWRNMHGLNSPQGKTHSPWFLAQQITSTSLNTNHHLPRKTAQEGGCHAGGLRRLATRIWKTLENCIAFQAFIYFHLQLLSLLGRSSVGPVFARLAAGKSIAVTGIFALASRFVPSNGCKENEKNTEAVSTLALNLRSNSEISRARQSMCIRMRMHAFSWLSPSQTMPEYPLYGWIVYIKQQHLQYVAMTRLCHQQDLKASL